MSEADDDDQEGGYPVVAGGDDKHVLQNKKRKVNRACNNCRRRKFPCDGPSHSSGKCSACDLCKFECSFGEVAKKPSASYVESLENLLQKALQKEQRRGSTSMGTSGGVTVERKLSVSGEATVVAAASGGSGSVSIGGISPTGGEGQTQCTNCKTATTPLWRRDPQGQPLCNACGLFFKLHGVTLPLSLKTDVIKKRSRNGSSLAASSRKTVPVITATGATRGIVTAKGRNSMENLRTVTHPQRDREEQWERSDRLRDFWEAIKAKKVAIPQDLFDAPPLSNTELFDFSSPEGGFMGIPLLKKPPSDVLLEELTYAQKMVDHWQRRQTEIELALNSPPWELSTTSLTTLGAQFGSFSDPTESIEPWKPVEPIQAHELDTELGYLNPFYPHSPHNPSVWSLGSFPSLSESDPASASHFSSAESLFAPQHAPPIFDLAPLDWSFAIQHDQGASPSNAPVPPLPAMPNGRFSGQRLKADQTLINRSFENDSIRRTLLNRVLQSAWYQQHKMEPLYQSSKDDVTQGLDLHLEPRKDSVFKAFLSTNGKCQFGEVEREECPKVESKLRRALGHVRFHLGHRPFMCSGCQKCANRSEKARFFSLDLLSEHRTSQDKRKQCPVCDATFSRHALNRHLETRHGIKRKDHKHETKTFSSPSRPSSFDDIHAEPRQFGTSQESPPSSSGGRDIKAIMSGFRIPGFSKGTAADTQLFDPGNARNDDDNKVEIKCDNCATTEASLWQKDSEGNTLCNPCGLFLKLHGIRRPIRIQR